LLLGHLRGTGKTVLTEPAVLLTEVSKLPGLDGEKMSKSYGNTIAMREDPAEVERKIKRMPTDPARVHRSDSGQPREMPVWQFHPGVFGCADQGMGGERLYDRGHRMPRLQAAGHRRDQEGAGRLGASAPRPT